MRAKETTLHNYDKRYAGEEYDSAKNLHGIPVWGLRAASAHGLVQALVGKVIGISFAAGRKASEIQDGTVKRFMLNKRELRAMTQGQFGLMIRKCLDMRWTFRKAMRQVMIIRSR